MVKNAIKRLILRLYPELGQRKHVPQLARIERIYDLPVDVAKVSSPFRAYKAVDVQLLDAVTGHALAVPIFEQVTLATGQANDRGVFISPCVGMQCLIQYIDGLDSMPVITALLPFNTLVTEHRQSDVTLQQSSRSKISGTNENWYIQTDGCIKQTSQTSIVNAQVREQSYHERSTHIATHDKTMIEGNQINEVMGSLKTQVGEKALLVALDNLLLGSKQQVDIKAHANINIESLKILEAKAADLARVQAPKIWVGSEEVNLAQIVVDLIAVVKSTNTSLAAHTHGRGAPPDQASSFTGYQSQAAALDGKLSPITA
ncbi:hypothetical protein [Shewanella surugensis]|uniref:Uncharacterized protein n=1 Tax=Shewanella surugensis TaxID=212020 RepID=A0ABT0L6H6_9GAMM|nr:hypothetical protein [Shewanella surugensis]MCL1123292.1 hypothetical protein [Shewanella surugensis]